MPKLTVGGEVYSAGAEIPDEGLIMAYVDDELDAEGRRYVEGLLARSAEAREIAELMRSSSALLKSAFLDDAEPAEAVSRNSGEQAAPMRGNPDAAPMPPATKQTRPCRPMTGTASGPVRLQRKA
jgi:anti-sigma factor RsiW